MVGRFVAVFFLLFSGGFLLMARDLSFGTIGAPKAGFLPALGGICAVLVATIVVVAEWVNKQPDEAQPVGWRKLLLLVIGLLLFVVFLENVGYFAATFIIMLYLLKVTETEGWVLPLLLSACVSTACYLIFALYLGVTFP